MKRKESVKVDLKRRFRNEKLEGRQMNFLVGGDDHGGEGGTDPWG